MGRGEVVSGFDKVQTIGSTCLRFEGSCYHEAGGERFVTVRNTMKPIFSLVLVSMVVACASCAPSGAGYSLRGLTEAKQAGERTARYRIAKVQVDRHRSQSVAVEADRAKLVRVEEGSSEREVVWVKFDQFAWAKGMMEVGRLLEVSFAQDGVPRRLVFLDGASGGKHDRHAGSREY